MAKKKAKTIAKKAAKAKKPSVAQRIAKMKRELEAAKSKATRQGQTLFKEAAKELFKEFKSLQRFAWPQYTPGWNDGDACEFGVHLDSLAVDDEIEGESECVYALQHMHELLSNKEQEEARIVMELPTKKENWEVSSLKNDLEILHTRNPDEVYAKYRVKKAIIGLLEGIDESVYEEMFGEGLVVVTRDGVTVEEYEHD
jgi:hypothetical protein